MIEKGSTVRVENPESRCNSMVGTVVSVRGDKSTCVRFPVGFDGHTDNGRDPEKRSWWLMLRELREVACA